MEGDTWPGAVIGGLGFRTRPLQPHDIEDKLTKEEFYRMSPEDLAFYGHTAGDWPEMKDLSSDLRAKIIEGNPEIQKARKDNLELKQEMGSEYGDYAAKREKKLTDRNDNITKAYNDYGVGQDLREAIDYQMTKYGTEMGVVNDEYESLIAEFDELDPSKNPYNRAKDIYFQVLYNDKDPLENRVTGDFNHKEYEARLEALAEDPEVAPYLERIEKEIAESPNRPDILYELKADRADLKPYWEITDNVIEDYGFTDKWEQFITAQGTLPQDMKEGAVKTDNLDWSYADSVTLKAVLRKIDEDKLEMRKDKPVIDALLWKWDYVKVLQNYTAIDWVSQIKIRPDQYGVISNKEVINEFIPLPRYQAER